MLCVRVYPPMPSKPASLTFLNRSCEQWRWRRRWIWRWMCALRITCVSLHAHDCVCGMVHACVWVCPSTIQLRASRGSSMPSGARRSILHMAACMHTQFPRCAYILHMDACLYWCLMLYVAVLLLRVVHFKLRVRTAPWKTSSRRLEFFVDVIIVRTPELLSILPSARRVVAIL